MIIKAFIFAVVLYGCAVLWMWLRQETLIFLPKHGEAPPEFECFRWDRTVNGVRHQGWFLDKGKTKTVIYYGGNAEDLAGHCEEMMTELDANILMVNYRGYGQSEGKPGEKELVVDSIALFDLFCAERNILPSTIYLMGRSLGCGVAVQVAAARPGTAGIILVTPFESMETVAHFHYPWLPVKGILRHTFRSIDYAPEIKTPALVVLAEFDEVVPIESGRKLGEALGGPKEFVTLPMSHNEINEHHGYFETVNRFINR